MSKFSDLFFLFALLSFKTLAGNIDLELIINSESTQALDFGDSGKFSLTLINHGPDDAGFESLSDFPISVVSSPRMFINEYGYTDILFVQDTSINQDCAFVISVADPPPGGNGVSYGFKFGFPPIPANSSITCYGKFQVIFASGVRKIKWRTLSSNDNDVNIGNEIKEVVFGIKPQVIPINSSIALLALILMIVSFAFIRFNRYRL